MKQNNNYQLINNCHVILNNTKIFIAASYDTNIKHIYSHVYTHVHFYLICIGLNVNSSNRMVKIRRSTTRSKHCESIKDVNTQSASLCLHRPASQCSIIYLCCRRLLNLYVFVCSQEK